MCRYTASFLTLTLIFFLRTLLSAVPRPLRLERILSVVSCIGVGNLVLIGAAKVQNDYFGSHLFRRPEEMKICLVEGTYVVCMYVCVCVRTL